MFQPDSKTDRLTLELRKKIARMGDGDSFPTVRQLIDEYGVSQPVVVAALKKLKEQGFLVSHVGRGTFVCRSRPESSRILLLQPDWPAPNITMIIPEIRRAVENLGGEFRYGTYDHRMDALPSFLDCEADLIILDSPTGPQLAPENIAKIVRSPVPVILSRREVALQGVNYICEDNHAAGAEIASLLYRTGHRRVAVLYTEPRIEWNTSAIRLRGFETFAALQGMETEIIDCEVHSGETPDNAIAGFVRRLKSGDCDFSAVFVISNTGAGILSEKLREVGVKIPDAISVVTLGDKPQVEDISTFATRSDIYIRAVEELAGRLQRHLPGRTQFNLPVSYIDHGSICDCSSNRKTRRKKEYETQPLYAD